MSKKYILLVVITILVVSVIGLLTYKASNTQTKNYTAESNNWRINLSVPKSKDLFGSLSCEYIRKMNGEINHFEYNLKGESNSISGSEEGNWSSGYKYEHGGINVSSLTPNEDDQYEITLTVDGKTEKLILTSK
ncbi:hypothetical protein [Paenibacillus jiagnxiensis]|uniref:hypothetical protein n=1 Tax=Paenibacillus jiagnxiensis TaxID=3228926 RepID=UPI0033B8E2BB